ncbi:hypothetical protein A3Q56_00902 [Intoshia linei]|uniref:Zinc finger C2H2 LYAR-type domain-containing protein n=1 Tax=Intoshia linei TaxID=1819745 RepID=A0A177BAK5_9BILA|nr:hypothetical protein A3Q56_00902 [Intoshia linei]
MVVFSCENCGDSLRKKMVRNHIEYNCKSMVTCMDCQKTFSLDTFDSHRMCVSEKNKYGPNFDVNQIDHSKGDKKQADWTNMVHEACNVAIVKTSKDKYVYQKLLQSTNIPKKIKKFMAFVSNSLKIRDTNTVENAWKFIDDYIKNKKLKEICLKSEVIEPPKKMAKKEKFNGSIKIVKDLYTPSKSLIHLRKAMKNIRKNKTDFNGSISVALPASILSNVQNPILQTALVYQISKVLAVYSIDEIIIFNENPNDSKSTEACKKMMRILDYLECPAYLRRQKFDMHQDLKFAGLLHPTNMTHHCQSTDECKYREGIIVDKINDTRCLVNVGLDSMAHVDGAFELNERITVSMKKNKIDSFIKNPYRYNMEENFYRGYYIRYADKLSNVFNECSFSKNGYDLIIGTSDKGDNVEKVDFPKFRHCLVVFGGVKGLENAVLLDSDMPDNVRDFFEFYVNTCPNQGTKTIRTEEAIWISMCLLRNKFNV